MEPHLRLFDDDPFCSRLLGLTLRKQVVCAEKQRDELALTCCPGHVRQAAVTDLELKPPPRSCRVLDEPGPMKDRVIDLRTHVLLQALARRKQHLRSAAADEHLPDGFAELANDKRRLVRELLEREWITASENERAMCRNEVHLFRRCDLWLPCLRDRTWGDSVTTPTNAGGASPRLPHAFPEVSLEEFHRPPKQQ